MKIVAVNTKKLIICIVVLAVILCFIFIPFFIMNDDKNIEYEEFSIDVKEETFEGEMKIAHLSDLHFPKIKVNVSKLVSTLNELSVDFIAITGDVIDASAKVEKSGVEEFIKRLSSVAPIYYVSGNHENANEEKEIFYGMLEKSGVHLIDNSIVKFTKGNSAVSIIGLSDNADYNYTNIEGEDRTNFKILLAHRPEWEKSRTYIACPMKEYIDRIPNLVLTGHAHGGQFRFFGKGLIAPNQGFFPKYDNGIYSLTEHTDMIVSRGLGNSIIPFRLNNPPHIPIITLKKAS